MPLRRPDDENEPRAYLNWMLLDEQFNYVASGSGFIRVPGFDDNMQTLAKQGLPITKSGYLLVYLSNETKEEKVFFDNLIVQHYTGPLTEENVYYPFGLAMAGISSKAAGRLENRKKFNGYEENKSFDLNWLGSFYRTYDPQLGRFWQVDPKAERHYSATTYSGMGNNPTTIVDPLGDVIEIMGNDGRMFEWSPGKQYKGHKGKKDEFTVSVIAALEKLFSTAGVGDVQTKNDNKDDIKGNVIKDFVKGGRLYHRKVAIWDAKKVKGDPQQSSQCDCNYKVGYGWTKNADDHVKTIWFNADAGLEITPYKEQTAGYQSASLTLLHEFGHAWQSAVAPEQYNRLASSDNNGMPA